MFLGDTIGIIAVPNHCLLLKCEKFGSISKEVIDCPKTTPVKVRGNKLILTFTEVLNKKLIFTDFNTSY